MQESTLAEIDDVLSAIDDAGSLDQVRAVLLSKTGRLGFDNFAYWLLWPKEGRRVAFFLGSYPLDWVRHYTAQDFKSSDLIANQCATSLRPFVWNDLPLRYQLSEAQRLVFTDAREVGLKVGGSIPIHGPKDAMAAFSVSNDCSDAQFAALFQRHRHALQLIVTYSHERIMQLGRTAPPALNARLTARELEVLTWTAKGKTRWEIGEILHISEETVKKHLNNASTRLQACNKTHAVAVALMQGIILP